MPKRVNSEFTEESRNLALPERLQDFSTSACASLVEGQGQSLGVVPQNCQPQKGFYTQVVERPYQNPRRRVGRGLVHQEYVEVRSKLKWRGGLLIPVPPRERVRPVGILSLQGRKDLKRRRRRRPGSSMNLPWSIVLAATHEF